MPATQRGQVYPIGKQYGIRYRDADGTRKRKSSFPTKAAAREWYRDYIEPTLRGEDAPKPELTLSQFVALYLERHAADVRHRTIATLTERLRHAEKRFG